MPLLMGVWGGVRDAGRSPDQVGCALCAHGTRPHHPKQSSDKGSESVQPGQKDLGGRRRARMWTCGTGSSPTASDGSNRACAEMAREGVVVVLLRRSSTKGKETALVRRAWGTTRSVPCQSHIVGKPRLQPE